MNQPSSDLASRQPLTKRKLLLIDANAAKCALRARIMGKAGLDVDCAGNTSAARVLWHANSYHLVLIDLPHNAQGAAEFCAEIKTDSPRQAVAFLVGKPAYLSSSPNLELPSGPLPLSGEQEKMTMLLARNGGAPQVRGGFLEAVWRMSIAERSLNDPRVKKTSVQSFGEAVRLIESQDRMAS